MGPLIAIRPLVWIVAVIAVVLATAALAGPNVSIDALAQTEPEAASSTIQIPPPVPGVDYSAAETGDVAPITEAAPPATPIPPAMPESATGEPLVPQTGGSYTTSLGGSDVAVESVGGSYEVDAPGRRGKRNNRP
jgi:hypothetical protein